MQVMPESTKHIQEFPDSVLLEWFDGAADFFHEFKLYLAYPWKIDGVYSPGQKIRIHKDAMAEKYTNHPQNRVLSLGAFSYCRTPLIAHDFNAGRYCSIATGVSLSDQEHPIDRISTHPFTTHSHMSQLAAKEFGREHKITPHQFLKPAPVIGNDVWIGQGAMIKRGITIGDGAVIGARALVTKDIPPYAVVGGTPAKVLKYRIPDEGLRAEVQALKWWDYNYADFPQTDPGDIPLFVKTFSAALERDEIRRLDDTAVNVAAELKAFLGLMP